MSRGIKNVSRADCTQESKALELQLSVQFIRARYFRINFAIPRRWSEHGRRARGESKVKLMRLLANCNDTKQAAFYEKSQVTAINHRYMYLEIERRKVTYRNII